VPVVDRPRGFSLWVSTVLPSDTARWELLDSGMDRLALERQAKGLAFMLQNRRIAIMDGQDPPSWRPQL
jgi:hypothetical protein